MIVGAIKKRLSEHLEVVLQTLPAGYDWFVICLQGSQNYGLADDTSDIDSKLMIIPSFEAIVRNDKPISRTEIIPNSEEHCDIKDVREYFKIFRKSNINFVEILFTKYYIVNPRYEVYWNMLLENNEALARINPYAAVSCMKGMAMEKRKALCHPYPSRKYWIDKFGYDPKQLSHLIRIHSFIVKYVNGNSYADCIDESANSYLLKIKRGKIYLSKEAAEVLADSTMDLITDLADTYREDLLNQCDPELNELLDNIMCKLIADSLKESILNEYNKEK